MTTSLKELASRFVGPTTSIVFIRFEGIETITTEPRTIEFAFMLNVYLVRGTLVDVSDVDSANLPPIDRAVRDCMSKGEVYLTRDVRVSSLVASESEVKRMEDWAIRCLLPTAMRGEARPPVPMAIYDANEAAAIMEAP